MNNRKNNFYVKRLVVLAVLAALAYAVHFIHIPVSFLNLDFKDVIITIGGMYFGPIGGLALAICVPLLEFITVSTTGVYGLIMNILGSSAFVLTASVIYRFKRTLTGAIVGLVTAVFSLTAVMIAANLFITPYYMGVSQADVVTLIPTLFLPFNAIKAVLNASLTLCLYKPITSVFKRTGFTVHGNENDGATSQNIRYSVLIWIIGGCVAVASLAIIFLVLDGSIDFL